MILSMPQTCPSFCKKKSNINKYLILYVSVTNQIREKKSHGHTSSSLVISFFLNEYFWQIQVDDNCLADRVEDSQLSPSLAKLFPYALKRTLMVLPFQLLDCVYYLNAGLTKEDCGSGFTTLPPVLLQKQPAVVLLLERALVSWSLGIDERGGHKDLCGSGRRSVIPYVHGRMELYCSSLPCLCEPEPFSGLDRPPPRSGACPSLL
jgi:hypothetical protein